jgi:hypothetical protein
MPKELDLPKGCGRCKSAPFVESSNGGVERCQCARGRQLYELDRERRAGVGSPAHVARIRGASRAKSRRDAGKAAANDKEQELFGAEVES